MTRDHWRRESLTVYSFFVLTRLIIVRRWLVVQLQSTGLVKYPVWTNDNRALVIVTTREGNRKQVRDARRSTDIKNVPETPD